MRDGPIDVVIEIPRGSRNKYEYDHERHIIRLDRRLFEIIQDIRRQLDVNAVAVEFEEAILRDCAGSVGEENSQGELQEQPRQPAGHADGPQIGQPVHGFFACYMAALL